MQFYAEISAIFKMATYFDIASLKKTSYRIKFYGKFYVLF